MFLIQHAYGAGTKISSAVRAGDADGVIWSPCDVVPATLNSARRNSALRRAVQATDPQLYVAPMTAANTNRKKLPRYLYFSTARGAQGLGSNIATTVREALDMQAVPRTSVILAPTITFDSTAGADYAVAQELTALSIADWDARNDARDLFVTVSANAALLGNEREVNTLLNWLTTLECEGFYLLFEIDPSTDERAQTERLARALWITYSLADNDYRVWVGYAGLGGYPYRVAGAEATASGWWQKGRWWSLNHWLRRGGRSPQARVALERLLSIPSVAELEALRQSDRALFTAATAGAGALAARLRSGARGVASVHRGRDDEAAQLFAVCSALDARPTGAFPADARHLLTDTANARVVHNRVTAAGIRLAREGSQLLIDIWDSAIRDLARRAGVVL